MWTLLLTTALAAEPYLALELRPLSRGDLSWIADTRTSGTSVGELDGFARPQALLWGGAWLSSRFALQGSLGVARLQSTTWVDEVYIQRHWGVVRPGLDARLALNKRDPSWPTAWVLTGAHLDVPSARDVSNGYSPEEQSLADQTATVDRVRLGAWGARIGLGADQHLHGGLSLGAQYSLQLQKSLFVGEDPSNVTSLLTGEGALLLVFAWPDKPRSPPH